MTVLSDFAAIQFSPDDGTFERPYRVGDNPGNDTPNGPLQIPFNTGGMHHSPALLTLMVRGITVTDGARVAIRTTNGEIDIGRLLPVRAEDVDVWRHEQFIIPTNVLSGSNSMANTLVIGRAGPQGSRDDFEVRDIVCFFHQST